LSRRKINIELMNLVSTRECLLYLCGNYVIFEVFMRRFKDDAHL
jgi:hypothetical protein